TAHLDQIERLNPTLNAIVTLTAESALEEAQAADAALAKQAPLGALHGLPVAHKDLFLTKGVRTTFGSPIYHDFIPEVDSLPVERRPSPLQMWSMQITSFCLNQCRLYMRA
nr:hypothetical protein [Oxalobacteraceae bacterium]